MNDATDTEQPPTEPEPTAEEPGRLTVFQIIGSTVAAAFGVQSSRNRARDFERGKPLHFIVAGVLFTALFVIGMIALVNVVLPDG